ncbi:hypothetical protein DHD05_15080 [Arenibacter sp. N53]|nr:hypothetical protein [Arenibacter sp. N53]
MIPDCLYVSYPINPINFRWYAEEGGVLQPKAGLSPPKVINIGFGICFIDEIQKYPLYSIFSLSSN